MFSDEIISYLKKKARRHNMVGRDIQILATRTADSMMLYVHRNRTVY